MKKLLQLNWITTGETKHGKIMDLVSHQVLPVTEKQYRFFLERNEGKQYPAYAKLEEAHRFGLKIEVEEAVTTGGSIPTGESIPTGDENPTGGSIPTGESIPTGDENPTVEAQTTEAEKIVLTSPAQRRKQTTSETPNE